MIYRLKEGVERFMITDINNPAATAMAQSSLPVMFDHVATAVSMFNHVPGGANVLFMDGHVQFQKYSAQGSEVPNEQVANAMATLSGFL